MKNTNIKKLELKCNNLRKTVLKLCYLKGGHISTSFSCVEILASLYYTGFLNVNFKNYKNKNRDFFILSKGHGAEILYAILCDLNFFSPNWLLKSYREGLCKLGGHADSKVPGIELSTGSLGHGLGFLGGIALSNKLDNRKNKHVVLLGDAECTAGSVWEAAAFISKYKLNNIIAVVDLNKIGATDFTNKFTNNNTISKKWLSFGWRVITVKNGNDIKSLISILKKINKSQKKPLVILANTLKGKGARILENNPIWHSRPVTEDIYKKALKDLSNV